MALIQSARRFLVIGLVMAAAISVGAASALLGVCGPFTDVAADSFCPFVLEIFTLGITTGTTPTTYDPAANVSRLQMAAFLSRSVDGVLKRGSRRAALRQFWTIQSSFGIAQTTVGTNPSHVESDGFDLWVPNHGSATVSRVRASDGKLLETWTGATSAYAALSAMGKIFVTGNISPGQLYRIDPSQPAGAVTTVTSSFGEFPYGIAFDGLRIWTANPGFPGFVAIVTPGAAIPWASVQATGGFSGPTGILYDGANIWVTDSNANTLLKLNPAGAILQTVTVGLGPFHPTFDGTNIWVPNYNAPSVSVVRASNGAVLATLTGNGLATPTAAAFDGQRILVTNQTGNTISLWKAADLTALGGFPTGPGSLPTGACSDGANFWITLNGAARLARF